MNQIKAYGHGQRRDISIGDSIHSALNATPREIADAFKQDTRIGKPVTIAPSDYGQTPTHGRLAGVTPQRWIIAREHNAVGVVHVHFPRQGFTISG